MSMQLRSFRITGTRPLLMNNPQVVDRFNPYALRMAQITAKKGKTRTDEDVRELQDIEVRSKVHWDDELGVVVPASWVLAALAKNSHAVAKISKERIRGTVVAEEFAVPLQYEDKHLVRTLDDIVGNPDFRHSMILPQMGKRVMKAMPIFHNWWFEITLGFDDKVIDQRSLVRILQHAAQYGGFGDFRPTFGKAMAEAWV